MFHCILIHMSEELTTAVWLASDPRLLYEFYQVFGQRAHISSSFHSFIRKLQLESSRKLLITVDPPEHNGYTPAQAVRCQRNFTW